MQGTGKSFRGDQYIAEQPEENPGVHVSETKLCIGLPLVYGGNTGMFKFVRAKKSTCSDNNSEDNCNQVWLSYQ